MQYDHDELFGCRCCECQRKMCMMWHPGHSHRDAIGRREYLDEYVEDDLPIKEVDEEKG